MLKLHTKYSKKMVQTQTPRTARKKNTLVSPRQHCADNKSKVNWTAKELQVLFKEVKNFEEHNPNKNISWVKIAQTKSLVDACKFSINNTICRSAYARFKNSINDPNSNDSIRLHALSQVSNDDQVNEDNEEITSETPTLSNTTVVPPQFDEIEESSQAIGLDDIFGLLTPGKKGLFKTKPMKAIDVHTEIPVFLQPKVFSNQNSVFWVFRLIEGITLKCNGLKTIDEKYKLELVFDFSKFYESFDYPPAKGGDWEFSCFQHYDPCENNEFTYYISIPSDVEPNASRFKYEQYTKRSALCVIMPKLNPSVQDCSVC